LKVSFCDTLQTLDVVVSFVEENIHYVTNTVHILLFLYIQKLLANSKDVIDVKKSHMLMTRKLIWLSVYTHFSSAACVLNLY